MDDADEAALYRAVGERVRRARAAQPAKMSQAALAERLGVSRASIVNIEAGRQHAPVSLLWKIAQSLDVEMASFIPARGELVSPSENVVLADDMRTQLKEVTKGDQALENILSGFISQAVAQLTSPSTSTKRPKRKAIK